MRSAEGAKSVIVGIRPESFEDAEIVSDDTKRHGVSSKAKIDLIEALGAENFAYFHLEGTRVDSDQLQEVAEDAGLGEVRAPRAAAIRRSSPASTRRRRSPGAPRGSSGSTPAGSICSTPRAARA